MRNIDQLQPATRALILDTLPLRVEEHVVHAWAAIDEARQGIEPIANLAYAERRLDAVRKELAYVCKPSRRVALGRQLIELEVDVERLRAELGPGFEDLELR